MGTESGLIERIRGRVHDGLMDHEQMLDEAADELQKACDYAERFASHLYEQLWKDSCPSWKPLSGDLAGLLTQIDNMIAGLCVPKHSAPLGPASHNPGEDARLFLIAAAPYKLKALEKVRNWLDVQLTEVPRQDQLLEQIKQRKTPPFLRPDLVRIPRCVGLNPLSSRPSLPSEPFLTNRTVTIARISQPQTSL